jgi:hypothetical protein
LRQHNVGAPESPLLPENESINSFSSEHGGCRGQEESEQANRVDSLHALTLQRKGIPRQQQRGRGSKATSNSIGNPIKPGTLHARTGEHVCATCPSRARCNTPKGACHRLPGRLAADAVSFDAFNEDDHPFSTREATGNCLKTEIACGRLPP